MTQAVDLPSAPTTIRPDILTSRQWNDLQALATSLSAAQALWVSGYLFALGGVSRGAVLDEPSPGIASATAAPVRTLTILYGSETGNSAALARTLADRAGALGLPASAIDMAEYMPRRLKDADDVLLITSTHGDGDPPQPAASFFEFLEGPKAPRLSDLRYAVLALGDSSYEHFCEAGKRLDRRLEALGAARLHERIDCDVDFDAPASSWTDAVLATLASSASPTSVAAGRDGRVAVAPAAVVVDRQHPLTATVVGNLVLTGRGSTKETRHVELSFPEGGLTFTPGDALGVVVRNDPQVVDQLIECLALSGDTPVTLAKRTTTLADALTSDYEIATVTPRFIDVWTEVTGADDLRRLTTTEGAAERAALIRTHHVIDLVERYRAPGISAETLLKALRPLTRRLYSIASSLSAVPDEVHLTVSVVRYTLHGRERTGVASGHLADRCATGETLPVYVQANPHFRLPHDDVPILMIGAGTGVAPYRAFLQEREARGAAGRSWLVFGERHFRTDFLYQVEWQDLLKRGVLTRMDVAFSRDAADKVYVQHRLVEQARAVFDWLEDGAHVYVCGDATRMAPDVDEALVTIVECAGGRDRDAAVEYVHTLQQSHRYQRDVY
ncbi:MAG TPA: assimilatory sulfite reductase (NADPH) flavoprotein subunit [Vicinamibacterales bacterium]|nr:assimilatory sulfite reductase (NADPH) flavoprotein subunit [Vicinamibacterales bacterium]